MIEHAEGAAVRDKAVKSAGSPSTATAYHVDLSSADGFSAGSLFGPAAGR